jgi:5-methylcytosine-specific restriction endonuclease McrA
MGKRNYKGYWTSRTDPYKAGSPGGKYLIWARQLRQAKGCCEQCGVRDARLELHHVNPHEHNMMVPPDQLLVLCMACHRAEHRRMKMGQEVEQVENGTG